MTDDEVEKLHDYLTSAAGIFVNALPFYTEVERMLQSQEYLQLAFLRTAALAELAKREHENLKRKEVQA